MSNEYLEKIMHIPIHPDRQDIYKAYIMCLNPLLKLKNREIEVLDIMTKTYFSLNKAVKQGLVPKEELYTRMHGDAGRKIMRDLIKMSRDSFNNHVSQLKKKKVITKAGELPAFITDLEFQREPLKIQYSIQCLNKDEIKATSNRRLSQAS
jgi:hypothetical protein